MNVMAIGTHPMQLLAIAGLAGYVGYLVIARCDVKYHLATMGAALAVLGLCWSVPLLISASATTVFTVIIAAVAIACAVAGLIGGAVIARRALAIAWRSRLGETDQMVGGVGR